MVLIPDVVVGIDSGCSVEVKTVVDSDIALDPTFEHYPVDLSMRSLDDSSNLGCKY